LCIHSSSHLLSFLYAFRSYANPSFALMELMLLQIARVPITITLVTRVLLGPVASLSLSSCALTVHAVSAIVVILHAVTCKFINNSLGPNTLCGFI